MDNGLSRRRQGFKSPWGRQQEIKRSNVLFKAYFYAFFFLDLPSFSKALFSAGDPAWKGLFVFSTFSIARAS